MGWEHGWGCTQDGLYHTLHVHSMHKSKSCGHTFPVIFEQIIETRVPIQRPKKSKHGQIRHNRLMMPILFVPRTDCCVLCSHPTIHHVVVNCLMEHGEFSSTCKLLVTMSLFTRYYRDNILVVCFEIFDLTKQKPTE